MAGPWIDDDDKVPALNIIPAYSYSYSPKNKKPMILRVDLGTSKRHMYFQDGAAFRVAPRYEKYVVAKYMYNKAPAALFSFYGKGKVAVSGFHPEAPASWVEADGLKDPDGEDIAFAIQMFQWVRQ